MKRITFTFLLLCAFVIVSKAQNTLLLHSIDGNATAYSFDDLKKITTDRQKNDLAKREAI